MVEELVVEVAAVVLVDGANISETQQVANLDLPLPTSKEQVYNTILLH